MTITMRCETVLGKTRLAFVYFFVSVASLANGWGESAAGLACGEEQRPNILFLFSDDHALQAISAYGSTINHTPNLDRIAQQGGLFVNSFCANSLCGPSRACILTGKHSHKNGFLRNGNSFDSEQMTFAKLLQASGYQTAVIGKWHLETDPTGFDYWEVLPGQGHYYNPDLLQMDGSRKRFEGYCTDIITEHAIDWLKQKRDPNKPFMLMCQHKAPHRNWAPPPRHFGLYKDIDIPEPATLFDDYSGRSNLLKENEMTVARHFSWSHDMKFHSENYFPEHFTSGMQDGEYARMTDAQKGAWDAAYEPENVAFIERMKRGELDERQIVGWKYQRYIKDYLRCIQAVDDSVGSLLDYLSENKLDQNTIVIYASDQGFYLGEHGWYDKRWMFEESLKMPFMIRWPGVIAPGMKSKALIQNIDYAPTFLQVAGVDIPAEVQGRSLMPLLNNQGDSSKADWRDAVYYAYYENAAVHNVPVHDGVRTERYKLMFFPRTRQWNLFDLETDPQEMHSCHDDPQYASILVGMQQRYQDLRQFYDVNSAVIPSTRGDEPRWFERDQLLSERAKANDVKLAFIGDSITEGWEGAGKEVWQEHFESRKAINLGIGGDRTEHVIWRLTHGNLGEIHPQVVVLMIGTNNTGHLMQDPAQVAEGVAAILKILRQKLPETQIILHDIFPRGDGQLDPARLNNVAINQRIRRLADGKQIHYVPVGNTFLEIDAAISRDIMPDLLHLSSEGYQRWATALEPKLKELGL